MKYKLLLFTLSLILVSQNVSSQDKSITNQDNRGYTVRVGDSAPDFEIEMLNGEKIKLSSLKGKVVMLQFTASWCSVCRKEMPYIESDIWQKNKSNKDFVLYGIDFKEDADVTAGFIKSMNITYPVTLDVSGDKFGLFTEPGAGVTRNVIIDRTGKIIMLTRLYDTEEFQTMVKLIDNELKK
mgnify:CR=1 FL=1